MDKTTIIQQALWCGLCDTIIISQSRHDYQSCKCEEQALIVDGGREYLRQSVPDKEHKMRNLSLTLGNTFEQVRDMLLWGTLDKDGRGPLRYVELSECELDHLKAIAVLPHLAEKATDSNGLYHAVIRALITEKEGEPLALDVLASHESAWVRQLVQNSIKDKWDRAAAIANKDLSY